ncbi:MAG: MFS transporter [Gammaproteobacteria bacterium]
MRTEAAFPLYSASDRRAIYLATFVRATATGFSGVLLAIYLAGIGFDAGAIGLLIGVGLAGATFAVGIVTFTGDRLGHRRWLILVTVLATIGALGVATGESFGVLAAAAFIGMVNGMGRDRGAAAVIEQALLPRTASDADRTWVFARYNALQDVGHALGSALAGLPSLLESAGVARTTSLQSAMLLYAALSAVPLVAYLRLSTAAEVARPRLPQPVASESRRRLWSISSLFALDSFAGGFLTTALVAYFFHVRFGVEAASLGLLFFGARVANALSHLAAAPLARRFGLVNTMVFTHIPSSLLLVTVAFAPSFEVAAVLFLLREGLVEMDVPTRQSYVMAIVRPEERAYASGITHLVRIGGWAVAAALTGWVMEGAALMIPLVVGAFLKILYDLLLWRAFRGLRPPEETARPPRPAR